MRTIAFDCAILIKAAKSRYLYLLVKLHGAHSVPNKPLWYTRLDAAIEQLEALPSPWVDRAAVEFALGVGRRRAQQILQPLVRRTIGKNGLANREEVVRHLRGLAAGQAVSFEVQRRERLHSILDRLHREQKERPRVLVEAPTAIVNQELDSLPSGVHLEPGRIVVTFEQPLQALEQLLALAMAIGNDLDGFDALIAHPPR